MDMTTKLHTTIAAQMLTLATGSFGLVAALAWNELIKAIIETYIRPYLGVGSGIISMAIYAIIITIVAVVITINLTKLQKRFETEESK
jgi:hypothetical protein